jgi:hypothetical protein
MISEAITLYGLSFTGFLVKQIASTGEELAEMFWRMVSYTCLRSLLRSVAFLYICWLITTAKRLFVAVDLFHLQRKNGEDVRSGL